MNIEKLKLILCFFGIHHFRCWHLSGDGYYRFYECVRCKKLQQKSRVIK